MNEMFCPACQSMVAPIWDDWNEKVVAFYCVYCGLLMKPDQPLPRSVFGRKQFSFNVTFGHYR
jgi:Zn ribbon nucleic-acid-binding protein